MVTVQFLRLLLTVPAKIAYTIWQYYTSGTVLQLTNREFRASLYKNVHLAVLNHFAAGLTREDVAGFFYQPALKLFAKYKGTPLTKGLRHYGAAIDARTTWIVEAESRKATVLFLHGGGYCVNIFDSQFVGITALYYAVPEPKRRDLSVALLDYSLTCHGKTYPTQIHEAVSAYRRMVDAGHTNIILVGDSCGTNLASAVARYIAYPDEAERHFSKFSEFEWDFSPMPQPLNLVFISPWLEPYTAPTLDPAFDYTGDLGATDTKMGDWYLCEVDRAEAAPWVKFTDNDYASRWANVDAVNGTGRTLYLYGDREHLKSGIEKFIDVVTKQGSGKLEVYVEEGGIHDGLFYVESLDYISAAGAERAVAGDFKGKYAYEIVGKFLSEVI